MSGDMTVTLTATEAARLADTVHHTTDPARRAGMREVLAFLLEADPDEWIDEHRSKEVPA